jgi:single-strand DNA-binding protein
MNVWNGIGRLTKDPDTRYTTDNMAVTRFTIAVDRYGKDAGADFISCVAFKNTAEFIDKYFHKGMKIGITGHIQTGKYDNKDGKTVYTTDVVVDRAEFVEKKADAPETIGQPTENPTDEFMKIPDNIDEEIPFN